MNRFIMSKNVVETSLHPNHETNHHMNRTSFLAYCPTQPLVDTSHRLISQNTGHSHVRVANNDQCLPPMSSFVTTNESQVVNTSVVASGRIQHPTHTLLTNQDLNMELLTAQTTSELEPYNGEALDPTFVDALNMSQFVFDPFLSDGQSIAAQVNNETEETAYYSQDMSQLSHVSTQNSVQSQNSQAFGLTMAPHISDIFSVFDSLTETDALTESLMNVNTEHYCASEPLVSQSSQTLNSNSFLQQSQDQQIQATTIHIPATLSTNQIITHSQPTVHLTPIVISRPSLPSQQIIGQPLLPPNETSSETNQTNQLSNITKNLNTNESQSMKQTIKVMPPMDNSNSCKAQERNEFKNLIEETKCYKCLICNFIALDKSVVSDHLNEKHKTETKTPLVEDESKASKRANTYMCSKCFKGFPTLAACRQHMVSLHKLKVDNVTLQTIESDQNISPVKDKTAPKVVSKDVLTETNDNSQNKKAAKLRHILPNGKVEAQSPTGVKKNKPLIVAKTHVTNNSITNNQNQNNQNNAVTAPNQNSHNNHITAKRIAWKRKLKREQGTYICEFKGCSVRFRALENLQKHHRCHSDSGSGFVCSNCNKNSEQWPSMAGHLWRNHGIDLELHACEHCSYRTYSLSILENIHKRIHSNEKNFLCDTCGKGFKNCKQLINHKVKHVVKTQSMKTYECHICLRTFTDARTRKVHLNTVHHKTRPYICSHCNHSAASRSALRTHMRLHTGEKPHKCDICSYSTSDHNSLRRHKMRHSGERKYKCPFCSYACIQSSTYKQHLKNKHPGLSEGIMFNCGFCGFKTVNQDMYGTHISEHMRNGDKEPIEGKRPEIGSELTIAPDSPIVQFGLIVGQSISSQANTPSISYA